MIDLRINSHIHQRRITNRSRTCTERRTYKYNQQKQVHDLQNCEVMITKSRLNIDSNERTRGVQRWWEPSGFVFEVDNRTEKPNDHSGLGFEHVTERNDRTGILRRGHGPEEAQIIGGSPKDAPHFGHVLDQHLPKLIMMTA